MKSTAILLKIKYKFKIPRKDATTNIHIKPKSCIDPSITKSVFEEFLHRVHRIYSEKYIKEETQFLIDMFVKNERKRTFIENLVKDYNVKKKNNDNRNFTSSKKIPWVFHIGPKIRKEFKK